jgi:hypothetical protein
MPRHAKRLFRGGNGSIHEAQRIIADALNQQNPRTTGIIVLRVDQLRGTDAQLVGEMDDEQLSYFGALLGREALES